MDITKEEQFRNMLKSYRLEEDVSKRKDIDKEIWNIFGETRAVLITDMSGFSYTTHKYGSVHFLSMIQRMQIITQDIVSLNNGKIVKTEADNCFIVFNTAKDAVQTAISLNLAFKKENETKSNAFDIIISCGIAYGDILLLDNKDMFGKSVILASKLGEDIADENAILITQEVIDNLPEDLNLKTKKLIQNISDIEIIHYKIIY
jgi:class 3 adenylate cyclase